MSEGAAQNVIAEARDRIDAGDRAVFERFAERLFEGVESHPTLGPSALAGLVVAGFEWISTREGGETRVRVTQPEDRPGHGILEVLQDDHSFIVDTLELLLARFGAHERFVLHPIMQVERDANGRLIDISAATNGTSRESYVYIEFAIATDDRGQLAVLTDAVHQVMAWVNAITQDHRRMIRAVRELSANLEFAGPALEGGRARTERVQNFLDFIIDGRFVFVGMRRYRVTGIEGMGQGAAVPDALEVQIVPGTGLGMWRDDESSRLVEPLCGSEVPYEICEDLEDTRIILISKSRLESRIHRAGRLDRILVKEHDDQGRVVGFAILVGLFTKRVLRTPGSQVPLLSERLRQLVDRLGLTYGSHAHQAIVTAFDSLPIELLVGADVDRLADLLPELVAAASSKSVQLVTRTHPRGRLLYAAILIPREHYREDLRVGLRELLERRTGARFIDDRTSFVEEGAAIVHCFCTAAEGETIRADLDRLEEEVRELCSPWEDRLHEALRHRGDETAAARLAARFEQAFPEALQRATDPRDAVRDVDGLERLAATGEPQTALYFDEGDDERETSTLRLYLSETPLLSDVLPIADHFGLRVLDAQLFEVTPRDRVAASIESLRVLPLGRSQEDLDQLSPRLGAALQSALGGTTSSDALNGLVLGAGLDWRQVDLLRAYVEYFQQIQGVLSRPYLIRMLLENPVAARMLVDAFENRFDPDLDDAVRERRAEELEADFEAYRDRISSLNEDRALNGFHRLISATLRTNFFAPPSPPHRVVLKLDSEAIEELTGVVPHREIWVHSADLEGIHLRGGPVARGGLRWSDRHDDLRVEILGLMSTQMLKNGIIVPVGAKGGFVLRREGQSPAEARQEADLQYRHFIASLLDVTDNLDPDGGVRPPPGVRRLDGDDPYLVVAADKGTAHLSDTANEIALARDFWLGDAFASGGSEGYDHKRYAITARGAWECVKHHLAELGIDPEQHDYEVAGIGDMSGDVFGNGLLLMRRAKLVAAFDHRHVFLDPDPDPAVSHAERQRLFDLPRSTWDDYDKSLLSTGGGVWPRSAKRLPIPEPLQGRLGLGAEASGQDVVRAILRLDVDVLWNGGIGTYVRASHETDGEVGDRANDAVRVEASKLRARIVGEGGNLGLTQAARVEAAEQGVLLDTDAIHNSAGVDLSDHEVNYKIALAPLVRSGQLDAPARRELLFDVADEACESVLAHNRAQALSISLDQLRSKQDPEAFSGAITTLCSHAGLDPADLGLPDADTVHARMLEGRGLCRPELAVILGLAKHQAQAALLGGDFPEDPYLEGTYRGYFPKRFCEEWGDALDGHSLRDQITALRVVNHLLDVGGATLFTSLQAELGIDAATTASALVLAEDIMRADAVRDDLNEAWSAPRSELYEALIELEEGKRMVARFLVKSNRAVLDEGLVAQWRDALDALFEGVRDFLAPGELRRLDERVDQLKAGGPSEAVAERVACLPLVDRGLNILRVAESSGTAAATVAPIYTRIGEGAALNWLYERLAFVPSASYWDRIILSDLRQGVLDLHRVLTEAVLERGDEPGVAVEAFLAERASEIDGIRALQQRAAAGATTSALAAITARCDCLRPARD